MLAARVALSNAKTATVLVARVMLPNAEVATGTTARVAFAEWDSTARGAFSPADAESATEASGSYPNDSTSISAARFAYMD